MSEEKKAYAGSAYAGAAQQEQKPVVAAADGGGNPPAGDSEINKDDTEGAERPRNQNVLPGILGKQLRAAYGELLSSPVPDRFNDLIKQLQRKEDADDAAVRRDEEESN